jgi:hypothetical protein
VRYRCGIARNFRLHRLARIDRHRANPDRTNLATACVSGGCRTAILIYDGAS